MTKEDKLRLEINRAQTAGHVLKMLDPILDEQTTNIVAQLKSEVRENTSTEKSLLSGISKLICLEDLRNSLESRMKRGEKASKEINNEH